MWIESSLNFHWRAALAFAPHKFRSLSLISTVKFAGNYRSCVSRFHIHRSIPRALNGVRTNIIRKHKRELWFLHRSTNTPRWHNSWQTRKWGISQQKSRFFRLIYGSVSTQLAAKFRQIWEDAFGKLLEFSISAFLDWQSRCRGCFK